MNRLFFFFFILVSALTTTHTTYAQDSAPNFILMIGDDMAIETLSCYKVGTNSAHTPNLDDLCDSGVRFDNFWSQPVCSPTRSTMLTGQYGFITGVGAPATPMQGINWDIPDTAIISTNASMGGVTGNNAMTAMGGMADNPQQNNDSGTTTFPDNAITFVQALKSKKPQAYQTAAVGKWHLASHTNGALKHPQRVGFDHYSGSIRSGGVSTYENWSKVIDGSEPFGISGYATTDTVDDGIKWLSNINQQQPWFLWVAFNAPHTPFHIPPKELLSSDLKNLDPSNATISSQQMYNAMIEAMDSEIGRLLNSLEQKTRDNTYIIFMGDNGTPNQTVSAPFEQGKAKGTLYQGGINVPLMIAGPQIKSQQVSTSLVNSVDMFATVLDLSNTPLEEAKPNNAPFHSVSAAPILLGKPNTKIREYAYADVFGTIRNGVRNSRAIRNSEYKLIQNLLTDSEELYNLTNDPYEKVNLLKGEQSNTDRLNYSELKQEMIKLTVN